MRNLELFVRESNHIEGIRREPTLREIKAHGSFLLRRSVTLLDLDDFVEAVAPGHVLRVKPGLNVRVGNHVAPPGGPLIQEALNQIVVDAVRGQEHPFRVHHRYETLHPFTDGNGRSGRVLWLWMMKQRGELALVEARGFLHEWYYQSLQEGRT